MALLVKVRAEKLDDTIDMSLRTGEPGEWGELGPLRSLRLIHSIVKGESSGRKVVSAV